MEVIILTLLLFTIPFASDSHCYYTGQIKSSLLLMGSIWLGYFLWLNKPKRPDSTIVLYFGWILLSYIVNPFRLGDPLEALLTNISYLTIYIAARDYLPRKYLEKVISIVMYIAIGWSLWSMGTDPVKWRALTNFGCEEWKLTFGNAGIMAGWLVMCIPLLLTKSSYPAFLGGLLLLWKTGSRAGVIAGIMGISVLVVSFLRKGWQRIAVITLGILLVSGILYKYADRLKLEGQVERTSYWSSALQMVVDKPVLGHGVGSFRVNYPLYRNPYITETVYHTPNLDLLHSHSWFLEMGAELGIVGVGLFLWLIYKHMKMSMDYRLIAGIFAYLISNLTDIHYGYVVSGFMLWVMLGISAREKEKTIEEDISNYWVH